MNLSLIFNLIFILLIIGVIYIFYINIKKITDGIGNLFGGIGKGLGTITGGFTKGLGGVTGGIGKGLGF